MTFVSLSEAVDWARDHWLERPVPLRLHDGETDGALGGLRYSASFSRHLNAKPDDVVTLAQTETCYHPLVRIGSDCRQCPDCWGVGVKSATRDRYRFPLWRAMTKLLNARNETPKHPHPAALVMALASADWDHHLAAHRISRPVEVAEALFLRAIRQLAGRYEEGPLGRVSWVDRSESQQRAEEAVA